MHLVWKLFCAFFQKFGLFCVEYSVTSVARLAIYWTLDHFLKNLATINLPKSPTFLGNFCKDVKIFHICNEIIFGQVLQIFGDFFWSHCLWHNFEMKTWTQRTIIHQQLHKIDKTFCADRPTLLNMFELQPMTNLGPYTGSVTRFGENSPFWPKFKLI